MAFVGAGSSTKQPNSDVPAPPTKRKVDSDTIYTPPSITFSFIKGDATQTTLSFWPNGIAYGRRQTMVEVLPIKDSKNPCGELITYWPRLINASAIRSSVVMLLAVHVSGWHPAPKRRSWFLFCRWTSKGRPGSNTRWDWPIWLGPASPVAGDI